MTNEEFREIAKQIPPSHPHMEWSFRMDCIRNHFMIYDGKKNRCVCTTCGYEFDIAPGEYSHMHGQRDICPCCETESICMSAGRGRRCYEERHRVLSFASDGKNLWMVMNNVIVRFDDFGIAQLYRQIVEVFKVSADEQKHWRYKDGWFSYPPYWEELKSYNPAPLPANPYMPSKYDAHIFTEGFDEILSNSDCRYLAGDELKNELQWFEVVRWISLQMKYPALELLRKGGFKNLASNRLKGLNHEGAINVRGKTIEKALRLPAKWVKALRRSGRGDVMTPEILKAFQRADDKTKQAAIENYDAFAEYVRSYRHGEYYLTITKHTTIEKYLKYMGKQKRQDPTWYCDYLQNANALGWDLSRKQILFPPDIIEAHDRASEARQAEMNAKRDIEIRKHAVEIDYQINDLMALCAMSQGELNKESKFLNHCVRTYGEKVAEGRTLIYFIRKLEDPQTPYYTLEIDPRKGNVVQCRGLRNCSMTEEAKEFRDGFEKAFKKKIMEGMKCQTT